MLQHITVMIFSQSWQVNLSIIFALSIPGINAEKHNGKDF
jgi:hypothetical protein